MKRASLALAAVLLMSSVSAFSQTITAGPLTMNFQGRLAKPDGTPVLDGTHTVTFRIYDAQLGGTKLWEEQIGSVITRNGVFTTVLGKIKPFDKETYLNGTPWLEITIDIDAPLIPRQQFQSVAFALKANTVPDNAITTAKIADGAITTTKLAPGVAFSLPYATTVITGNDAFSITNNDGNGLIGSSVNKNGVGGYSVNSVGVYGQNANGNNGALGSTEAGVVGISTDGVGLYGISTNSYGVYSQSTNSDSIIGISTNSNGVVGVSTSGYGVVGNSVNDVGVFGTSTTGRAGYFAGDVTVTGNFSTPSDARYKTNINVLGNALDEILALRGVTYDYKRDDFKAMNFPKGKQVGFIAQELEKVLPELVHTDKDGYKSVDYIHVVPVLVEAVKAQQKQIDELKEQVKALLQQSKDTKTPSKTVRK